MGGVVGGGHRCWPDLNCRSDAGGRCDAHPRNSWPSVAGAHRQRRHSGIALGGVFRRHQGLYGRNRSPRLRELSVIRAAVERLQLGWRWRGADAITALAVVLGLALLAPVDSGDGVAALGLAWGVLSGLSFALLAVRNRGLRNTHSAIGLALWQNAFAALWLLPVLAWQGIGGTVSAEALTLLLVLGVLCTALAHTLFIASLAQLTAHTASVVAALEPVYGITLAVLLLDEIPDWHTIAGAVLIVGASIYASRNAQLR